MTKIKSITLVFLLTAILFSCQDDEFDKYERPAWLAGKVYTQILDRPELSTFAKAVELTEYDQIINISGSYTVFAPSNEAFEKYFSANSKYNSIESMPVEELSRIVKYHIVQNPWSKSQLRTLDVYGWIDTLDVNNDEPRGFKRETLLLNDNRKYGVKENSDDNLLIVDTTQSNWTRKVTQDSRKYSPIFFSEYFNIYDLSPYDYEFYFNRPFEGDTNIYYANAKVVSGEIFAENGFVYVVDEVVQPLDNAAQILEDEEDAQNYSDFLKIINRFPDFSYNEEKTEEQPGAELGLVVDSLFDLTYPELTFDINKEETSAPEGVFINSEDLTVRYHYGLMAPTNSALQAFENQYFANAQGWGSFEGSPRNIQEIIANSYMSINPVYPSDFENGFYNGELDYITLNEGNIIHKEFGSNASFIGLNEALVPRAFSSILGPVYLRRGYRKVMFAIEESGLKAALKRPNKDYSFYVESDASTSIDSSLMYDPTRELFSVFMVSPTGAMQYYLTDSDLRTLLLNHVATKQPKGIARKEFIPNLAGNYIIYDNVTGIVSGTNQTTIGYNGTEPADETPSLLFEGDNGSTYDVDNWFSFSVGSMYNLIKANYKDGFHKYLVKAGFDREKEFRYSFMSPAEFYTVFVPSDSALTAANVDEMSIEELRSFLMLHFVQGQLIFTDGSQPSGYYQTLRRDEASTEFSTVYTQIYVNSGIDVISIKAEDGSNYVEIHEGKTAISATGREVEVTNMLVGVDNSEDNPTFKNIYNNGVIHEIDKVLTVDEVDTN